MVFLIPLFFRMLQDCQGFMLFGTEDDLTRYDGLNFTIFKSDPDDPNSLGDKWIWEIFVDQWGNLWIGTSIGSFNRYDDKLD